MVLQSMINMGITWGTPTYGSITWGDSNFVGPPTPTTAVTYENVCDRTQEIIRTILVEDLVLVDYIRIGGIGNYSYNIFNGEPTKIVRNLSSYIIVNTPAIREKRLTLGADAKMDIEITITKSGEFFNFLEKENVHIYKESCPCESCFHKSSDYTGNKQRANNYFLA